MVHFTNRELFSQCNLDLLIYTALRSAQPSIPPG